MCNKMAWLLLLLLAGLSRSADARLIADARGHVRPPATHEHPAFLTVQSTFSDTPLLLPMHLKPVVEEAFSLYDAAGSWPAAIPEPTRRHMVARMEAILTEHVAVLPPLAMSVGNGLASLGNHSGAEYWFARCAQMSESVEDWVTAGIATMNLGFAESRRTPPRALELLGRALALLQRGRRGVAAFWLGNTASEMGDLLVRGGHPVAGASLLDHWLWELRGTPFHRLRLLRGNIAWHTQHDYLLAWGHWLAGADAAAREGDAGWVDKLTLTAYATAAVVNSSPGRPVSGLSSEEGTRRTQAANGDGGVNADNVAAAEAAAKHREGGSAAQAAATHGSSSARVFDTSLNSTLVGGLDGEAILRRMHPSRVVQGGVAKTLGVVRALLQHVGQGSRAGDGRSTAADEVEGVPPPGTLTSSLSVSQLLEAAVASLPWAVLGVTASRRNVLWQHWSDVEDAAVFLETLCVVAMTHAGQRLAAAAAIGGGVAPFPLLPHALRYCASHEEVRVYALPYEHIGFGAGMQPFPPALLAGVSGIFTATLAPAQQQAALQALSWPTRVSTSRHVFRRVAQHLHAARAQGSAGPAPHAHPLHVGLLSYDLRAHASAWLAEGYVRYFNRSRVALTSFHYGPVDKGAALVEEGEGGSAAASGPGWRRMRSTRVPAGAESDTSGVPSPGALVAALGGNATVTDRIALASDAFYVPSTPADPASALSERLVGCTGTTTGTGTGAGTARRVHVIDEHMGHTFGARYGLLDGPQEGKRGSYDDALGRHPTPAPLCLRPLVVSFMYPGSTASRGVDFIVADTVIAPPEEAVQPLVTREGGGSLSSRLASTASLAVLQAVYAGGLLNASRRSTGSHGAGATLPRVPLHASTFRHTHVHVLGQAFSERLLLMPHAYTAHFYSCVSPLYGGRDHNNRTGGSGLTNPAVSGDDSRRPSTPSSGLMARACALAAAASRYSAAVSSDPPAPPRIVLASLNAYAKLEPAMFSVWANVLRGSPSSVLLLLDASPELKARVAAEAAARGLHPARLAFAPPLPRDGHVGRYTSSVDLVLDPRLITGHTTTADGLWAGVPTVTLEAGSLAGRVSSSFMQASGAGMAAVAAALPSLLVTHGLTSYEASVGALVGPAACYGSLGARNPQCVRSHARRLWALRRRVLRSSLLCPMLDWVASKSHLERGYRAAWEMRAVSDAAPAAAVSAPVPSWQQGGYHVAVDPDYRRVRCRASAAPTAAAAAAKDAQSTPAPPPNDAEQRAALVSATRWQYERAAVAALREAGFATAAALCEERLALAAGVPIAAAGSGSGGRVPHPWPGSSSG